MHILVAGFQHETNTFAPSKAGYDNFVRGEGFPAMVRGEAMLALRQVNIPAGGFINAVVAQGHTVRTVIWAGASPSAHVTTDAYERIAGEIVEAAREGGYDAVYLDLHGAMVAEHLDDGEGELLARVRQAVGPAVPVIASLDLHANVTAQMLGEADGLAAFRTYPHVDMADTGEHAARLLLARLEAGANWHRTERRLPFLIPINGMCTLLQPSRGVYEELAQLEQAPGVVSISFAPGFPPPTSTNAARWSGPTAPTRPPPNRPPRHCTSACWRWNRNGRPTFWNPPRPCAAPRPWPPAPRARWSSPTRRTIPARAATPTPPACCARWSRPTRRTPRWACSTTPKWWDRQWPPASAPGCACAWAGNPAWPATAPSKASSRSRRFRRAGCALTAP